MAAADSKNPAGIVVFGICIPFALIGSIKSKSSVTGVEHFLGYQIHELSRLLLPGLGDVVSNCIALCFGDEVSRIVGYGPSPGLASVAIAETAITTNLNISTSEKLMRNKDGNKIMSWLVTDA